MNPPHTGPNIYPTLPPIQNPQYPSYNPHAQGTGYFPPAQYGNVQAQAGIQKERERQGIVERIAKVEKGLDSCFIKIYQVWLWVLLILSIMAAAFISFWFVMSVIGPNPDVRGGIFSFSLAVLVWIGVQSVLGLQAISQKSIQKANTTCWMVTLSLIPSLFLDIYLIIILAENPHPSPGNQGIAMVELLVIVFSVQILLHVAISMVGAFKVKKILMEKEVLQEKLNEVDYSFKA
jgi:hypothetical protein